MKEPKIIFYGGVGTTTGANIMIEFENRKILIDCGLLQGTKYAEERNFENFKYNPAEIDFLLITHAHMDHIGRVPKLIRDGFKGQIISTQETKELARPMLEDALKVLKARHQDKALFEKEDIEKTFSFWEGKNYGEKINLFEGCSLKMQNAGHILGSAILILKLLPSNPPLTLMGEPEKTTRIAFTGDLGNSPSPLLPDAEVPKNIDYLVMESVYGDRNHESKEARRKKLKQAILEGIKKDGAIIIPTFSIERTQILLYEINNMVEDREIQPIPVFLDSPLAEKVTEIYKRHQEDFKESIKQEIKSGDNIFDFSGLRIVKDRQESEEIEKIKGAKIILAGSGMSEGGRVVNHEINYLSDPKATIILVGFQSVGTLGRRLEEGVKEITPPTPPYLKGGQDRKHFFDNKKIKVKAKIEVIKGYSSHMDSEHLLEFVERSATTGDGEQSRTMKLKKVFVIMGEPKSSLFLTQRIRDYLDIDAIYPEERREYELK